MIIVRLKGGLGNQMFQYALGRVLALKNNTELKLDLSFLNMSFKGVTKRDYDLDVFDIKASIASDKDIFFVNKIYKNKVFIFVTEFIKKKLRTKGQEKDFSFDKEILNLKGNIFLNGYWQSSKYFKDYEDILKKDFTLLNIDKNVSELSSNILLENALCVHIRRGDYVGNPYHDVLSNDYYDSAVKKIEEKGIFIQKIYVFSDDIEWCKNNFKYKYDIEFVSHDYNGKNGEGHMYLMSCCKYFIIPNSTFSWWGAWLSERDGKVVICPQKWFADESINTSDLIPEDWIKI